MFWWYVYQVNLVSVLEGSSLNFIVLYNISYYNTHVPPWIFQFSDAHPNFVGGPITPLDNFSNGTNIPVSDDAAQKVSLTLWEVWGKKEVKIDLCVHVSVLIQYYIINYT